MSYDVLTENQMRTICRELCEGIAGARSTHPRLIADVNRASYIALHSRTFRRVMHDAAAKYASAQRSEAP